MLVITLKDIISILALVIYILFMVGYLIHQIRIENKINKKGEPHEKK